MPQTVSPFWKEVNVYAGLTRELKENGKSGQPTDEMECLHCGKKAKASLARLLDHLSGKGGQWGACCGPSRAKFPTGDDGKKKFQKKQEIWMSARIHARDELNRKTNEQNRKKRVRRKLATDSSLCATCRVAHVAACLFAFDIYNFLVVLPRRSSPTMPALGSLKVSRRPPRP